ERRLMDGELLGVSATDALELGIDIGLLDCAISVGFPGTVSSLRQQWGRAGRRGHGLAILVASEDALDQFFVRDPEALLSRRVEVRAGEEGDLDADRGAVPDRAASRPRASLRRGLGDRAGRRLPEEGARRHDARDGRARAARDELRDRGGLVPAGAGAAARA